MNQNINLNSIPSAYAAIQSDTTQSGFTMASDIQTCALLKTLAASKPGGRFLELGTGTGLATAWILDGMDSGSSLISVDNDAKFLEIARQHLSHDWRLTLVDRDGGEWLTANTHLRFDFIFADTWHGKYLMLEAVLEMLTPGGLYIIDDMLPQPNWPDGHQEKSIALVNTLEQRHDLVITKMHWATGIVIAAKKEHQRSEQTH